MTASPLIVTADAQSRIYGSPNPAPTYVSSGLVNGDTLSGLLATVATTTSNVGSYGISQGTLAASSNYALAYNAANLAVTTAPLTVTAAALTVTTANVTPQPILPVVPSINVVTNIVTASLPAPPIPDTTLQEPTLAAIQPIPVVTDTEAVSLIRPPVLNVRKQFESIVCHPKQAYDQRRLICSQPYGFSSDAVAASDTSAPGTGKPAALTIAMRIGNVRTPLRIVDGGMRLPGNIVR